MANLLAYTNLTSFDGALKDLYIPKMRKQYNDRYPLRDRIQADMESIDPSGTRAYISVEKGMFGGTYARAEGVKIPSGQDVVLDQLAVPLHYFYAPIEISGQVKSVTGSGMLAYVKAMSRKTKGAVTALKYDTNHMYFRASSGKLTNVNVVTTLSNGSTGTTYTEASPGVFTVDDISAIRVGLHIDIRDPNVSNGTMTAADNALGIDGGLLVISTAVENKIVVVKGTTGTTQIATDDVVHIYGNANTAASVVYEADGFGSGIHLTNTYLGLARGTTKNYFWKSNVFTNSGVNRALREDLVATAIEQCEARGGHITAMYMNPKLRNKFAELIMPDRRFVNTRDYKGGYTSVDYAYAGTVIDIITDTAAGANQIWGIDESTWLFLRQQDLTWLEDQNGSVLQKLPNYDLYEATLALYENLACGFPGANFRLGDLSE